MKFFREVRENAETAVAAASRAALAVSRINKRLDDFEARLSAIETALNDNQSQKLRAEKDYIEGMYNMLNYNVDVAKKAKGRELNE